MAAPDAVSSRGMKNQVRIRGPKPDVCYHSKSLEELETLLSKHISTCRDKPVPETAYAQFIFDSDVTFRIRDAGSADGIREHFPNVASSAPPSSSDHPNGGGSNNQPISLPVSEAVAQVPDTKTKLRRQRAVGRAILRSIQDVDGFNYFEKEAWDTKHADGYRFKYLCKDSYQNKDRALNKTRKSTDASSFHPANGNGTPGPHPASATASDNHHLSGDQSPSKGDDHVSEWFKKHGLTRPAADSPARLPTYDCKGSIFVKFSSSQHIVDVVYQHMPMHNATNERAPDPIEPPKMRTSLAGNGLVNDDSGDPMDTSEMASYATPQAATPVAAAMDDSANAKGGNIKKRKRTSKAARHSLVEAEETSDVEGLDDEWGDLDNQAPPLPLLDPSWEPDPGDGDLWRPSVVTLIPGLKTQSKHSVRKSYGSGTPSTATAGAATAGGSGLADDSSASGSDFDGGKKPKKKPGPKPKGKASAAAATATAAKEKEKEKEREAAAQESDRAGLRRRTKTGCWTCRSRKLKCDESRPQCTQCARSRPPRDCSFPEDEEMSDAPPL